LCGSGVEGLWGAGCVLCGFERLVGEPEKESERIFEFLGMGDGVVFEPRGTKEVGFREEERELILEMVGRRVKALFQKSM